MVMFAVSHLSTTSLGALTVLSVLAVLVSDVEAGRHHVCPPFSCGGFSNISYPFRRQGDPSGCGVKSYQLVCTDTDATIRIGSGTYNVLSINYTHSYFWVVDANLDMQSSCPLPRWDYHYDHFDDYSQSHVEYSASYLGIIIVKCSQEIKSNVLYTPVYCVSTNYSFIYLVPRTAPFVYAYELEPSCGYLAGTPFGGPDTAAPTNTSYPDVKFMRQGFALGFPLRTGEDFEGCLEFWMDFWMPNFGDQLRGSRRAALRYTTKDYWIPEILTADMDFWQCVTYQLPSLDSNLLYYIRTTLPPAMWFLKTIHVLCRFILMPLAVFIFLAYKYWKTRITIDAVEKFLRMQQMLVPMRYAYTDIIAITSHFRDKLGQGGYGSVYKGVLLPGEVHVAVKMLGNSNCNGEEFISEVATIGKIHHFNVVRLIGFCSEETNRTLIYEYMPCGSLDKYIFSSEKSFSWDKLNEIALGIARGINYLHQGCDMQIVHFDIKPHNILLDNNFVPKVADFGLAKLFPRDNSFLPLSAMRGTIGYIAPEMVSRSFGAISSKSDVYSFGMLLLEMTGGRRNADPSVGSSSRAYYPSWVYSQLNQEDVAEIREGVDMH